MIFCVDDDDTIRDIEVYTLEQTGFEAKGFADGDALFEGLKKELPDLIVLDVMLPGKDGVTILNELRNEPRTQKIPVIMATAKGSETDKIKGLDAGADDYLAKPFGMMEMVARIKAVLRRSRPEPSDLLLRAGKISLDPQKHTVFADGKPVALTVKEFDLLKLFLENPGIAFTRERLLSEVWGESFLGESRTVDVHIKTLRKKLGNEGSLIKTVIGIGYRLEGME